MHMKISRKVVITSLALLAGASLAGSVSSTIAWFQYATRAQVAYTGTTSHCSKVLRVSANNGISWGNNIVLSATDTLYAPITTGPQLKDAALTGKNNTNSPFYAQPNPKQGLYANWFTASESFYGKFNLLIKVNDVDTNSPQLVNDVYLTDVTIEDAVSGLDLSNAIRVHVATTWTENSQENHNYFLFAKSATSTEVGGYLDLDNDGVIDRNGYEWDQSNHLYGGGTVNEQGEITTPLVQTSYLANDSTIIATESATGELSGGTSIGKTGLSSSDYLQVTITVWLEGWAMLATPETGNADQANSARIWKSASYAHKDFHVGISFGVKLHSDADHPATTNP